MVLKLNEIKSSDALNEWNSYNIDYVQVKLDIKKAVAKLTKAKKRHFNDLKKLLQLAENTKYNRFDSSDSNGAQLHKKRSNSSLNTINSSKSSTTTASTVSSLSASTPEFPGIDNKSLSPTFINGEIDKLEQSFRATKSGIVISLLYKTLIPQLKRIDSFIYLKKLEIIQNIQANNNNFRDNNKTILKEILRINNLLDSQFLNPLIMECEINDEFIKNSRSHKSLKKDNQHLKFLNVSSINDKILKLEILNDKLGEKIDNISKLTFLNLKTFLHLQKEIIYHLIHFFNKLILKYEISSNNDDNNINYIDYLYLVNGFQSLKIKKSYKLDLDLNFLNVSQGKLLLSYNERFIIYKFIFSNFFNLEFDQFAINNIFGNTVYEKEFIYFDFKLNSDENSNSHNSLTASSLISSIAFKNLKLSKFTFWNVNFELIYQLLSICLSIINDNNVKFSQISTLSNFISLQRQFIHNPQRLQNNSNLDINNLSQFFINEEISEIINDFKSLSNPPKPTIDQIKEFDLLSLNNNNNNQWFLIPIEYIYELIFKLDLSFINIGNEFTSPNLNIDIKKHKILQILEKCSSINTIDETKQKEKIHYFGTLEFDGSSLYDLIPVEVLEYNNDTNNEDDLLLAAGFAGQLGRFTCCEFRNLALPYSSSSSSSPDSLASPPSSSSSSSTTSIVANSQQQKQLQIVQEIMRMDGDDTENLNSITHKYFNDKPSNLRNFKSLFIGNTKNKSANLKTHELTSFEYSKKRRYTTSAICKPQNNSYNTNVCISLYEGIEFKVPNGKISDNFRNFCLLEINWPEDVNMHTNHNNSNIIVEHLKELINCEYLYDLGVDNFNPFIYSLLSFNVFPKIDENMHQRNGMNKQRSYNSSEGDENATVSSYSGVEDSDDDEEYHNYEWFGKIMSKKFKLKLGIDARVFRSMMKNQLQMELQKQQQQHQERSKNDNERKKLRSSSNDQSYDSSKPRYWNEFDDNPDFANENDFYVVVNGDTKDNHSNSHFLISEQLVNFFMNFSYLMKSELKTLKKKLLSFRTYKFKYRGNNLLTGYTTNKNKKNKDKKKDPLLPYYVSHSDHHHYNSITNINNNNSNNNNNNRFYDSDSEEDTNYFPDIDPQLEKLQNYDIISSFLYFVLSFISMMIISVILILEFSYMNEISMNLATYILFLSGILISNCSCFLSLMIYSDRKSVSPLYHTVWLSGVTLIVVLFSIVLIIEIFQL